MTDSEEYLADLYSKMGDPRRDFRNSNLTSLVVSEVKGQKVLDIGCGNGFLLSMLQKEGRDVFGIEPNKALIKLAKIMNEDLTVLQGYAGDIDKFSAKLDTITMIDVLEHIEDDNGQLEKVFSHLHDGGCFILVVPAFKWLYGKRDQNNGHFRRYSKKEVVEKLRSAGFLINKIRYWNVMGFLPYIISEKLLRRELNIKLREEGEMGLLARISQKFLHVWFRYIENKVNFRLGLSLICISEKPVDALRK